MKNNRLIRTIFALLGSGHIVYAGPFGLCLIMDKELRICISLALCVFIICVILFIESILRHVFKQYPDPAEDGITAKKRNMTFQIISIIIHPIATSLFLHFVDTYSGVNHLAWTRIFDVFVAFAAISGLIGLVANIIKSETINNYIISKKNEELQQHNNEVEKKVTEAEKKAEEFAIKYNKMKEKISELEQKKDNTEKIIKVLEEREIEGSTSEKNVIFEINDSNYESIIINSKDFILSYTKGNYTIIWYLMDKKVVQIDFIRVTCGELEKILTVDSNIKRCSRQSNLNVKYIDYIEKKPTITYVKMKDVVGLYSISDSHITQITQTAKTKNIKLNFNI